MHDTNAWHGPTHAGIDRAEEYSLWLPKGVPLANRSSIQKVHEANIKIQLYTCWNVYTQYT